MPLVSEHHKATLDDIDLVGFFELALEDLKLRAALRARLIGLIERVDLFDARELGLLARAVPGLLLLFGAALVSIALFVLSPNSA